MTVGRQSTVFSAAALINGTACTGIISNSRLVFEERRKPEYLEKNLFEQSRDQKIQPIIYNCRCMMPSRGIEPSPHWWEPRRKLLPLHQPINMYNYWLTTFSHLKIITIILTHWLPGVPHWRVKSSGVRQRKILSMADSGRLQGVKGLIINWSYDPHSYKCNFTIM